MKTKQNSCTNFIYAYFMRWRWRWRLQYSSCIAQTPTPPTPPPSLSFDELKAQYEGYYEYQNQWGLVWLMHLMHMQEEQQGRVLLIGITDSGLDIAHVEIMSHRISYNSALLIILQSTTHTRQKRHGTMVAAVAAGKLDQTNHSNARCCL